MQSNEVKHSLQQLSAAICSALWSSAVLSRSLQSSFAHSSEVPSTQVQCNVFPSGTLQFHKRELQQSSSVKCCPVQSSPVQSSPVQSSPVQSHPLKYSAVYFNLERNVERNALRLSQVKYNLKQCGAVHQSKVPFRKGHIQVPVSAVWSSHSSLMKCLQMLSWRAFSK